MNLLGNGLSAKQNTTTRRCPSKRPSCLCCGALASQKATYSSRRPILRARITCSDDGTRPLLLRREVYSGWLRLHGEEHEVTLTSAGNYGESLVNLGRFEAKSLLRKLMPVARRVLGESDGVTLKMRWSYARGALQSRRRHARRSPRGRGRRLRRLNRTRGDVLGSAHPFAAQIERNLHTHEPRSATAMATSTPDASARPWRRWAARQKNDLRTTLGAARA